MIKPLLFAILLCGFTAAAPVAAQEKKTLGDLKADNAQQLSRNDLQSLMPEASVISTAGTGSSRRWKNEKDGTFIAASNNAGQRGSGSSSSGKGVWSINDQGQFCVVIDWARSSEKWCRTLFRKGDVYYGVSSLSNDATLAYRFEITK